MKITKVEIKKLNISDVWTPVICRIYTDEGIYGDGEAALAFGVGATGVYGILQDYAKQIIGMDPMCNELIWDKLYRYTFWGQAGGAVIWGAISAIDIALWDIKGKKLQVPLHVLLGGKRRDSVRCYASQLQMGWEPVFHALATTQEYVDAAKKVVAEGYDALKVNFFVYDRDGRRFAKEEMKGVLSACYMDLLEERIAAVREAVGPGIDIIMENHANMDAVSAVQVATMAEKYGIFFFEEPATPNAAMNKVISEKIHIPIAQGERIFTRWQFAPYFENRSVQIIQPDIGNCGGLTEAKKICDMANVYDVSVQAHVCASPLSTAVALHLESVIPNFIIHEHHRNCLYPHNQKLCTMDYQPVNGRMMIPDGVGIGCEFTDETMHMENSQTTVVQ